MTPTRREILGPRKARGSDDKAGWEPDEPALEAGCWFKSLYEATHDDLIKYALRRTETAEDAADLVSETFLVAWRRLDAIPRGEEARLWLFGTARRLNANRKRSDERRRRLFARLASEPAVADASIDSRVSGGIARSAWERLRPDQRDLLGLIAWDGLSMVEVARVLGCSTNAAKIRVHRARRRFESELSALEDGARPDGAAHTEAVPYAQGATTS